MKQYPIKFRNVIITITVDRDFGLNTLNGLLKILQIAAESD